MLTSNFRKFSFRSPSYSILVVEGVEINLVQLTPILAVSMHMVGLKQVWSMSGFGWDMLGVNSEYVLIIFVAGLKQVGILLVPVWRPILCNLHQCDR